MAYKQKSKKHKKVRIETVIAHVKSSFNNILVSITNPEGEVLLRCSAGKLGFKGARKGTPFARRLPATEPGWCAVACEHPC